jgi:YVTN family beta-propeller protein
MNMANRKTAIAAALALLFTGAMASPGAIASPPLADDATGIAFDPVRRHAYVANYEDGTLSAIDVDTLRLVATIAAGDKPRRVVANAALERVYFVNDTVPGQLTVLDAATNGVLARVSVGNRPREIAADFQKGELYVTNYDSDSISIVDVATNAVVAMPATGRHPTAIDVNPRLGRIYVVSSQDGTLTVIDQNNPDAQWSVPLGRNPAAATVDERTGKVYVNNVDDKTVSVLDGDGKLVATLPAGAGSTFGTVSAVHHRYYLPNAGDGTLTIIDTDHDVVANTIVAGPSPQQAIIDEAANKIYVANGAASAISVVDASTEAVEGSFAVGSPPSRIASAMNKLFVLNGGGNALEALLVGGTPSSADPTAIVTEYHHAASGRYFHTADPLENRLLADGLFDDQWTRTMRFWRVWTAAGPGRVPICRFDSAPPDAISHVYVAFASQCETLKSSGTWHYEGLSYYVSLPNASGTCESGTVPLYRLQVQALNVGFKQRFTTDGDVVAAMLEGGWALRGVHQQDVFACVPPLVAAQKVAFDDRSLEKPIVRPIFHKPFPNVHLP